MTLFVGAKVSASIHVERVVVHFIDGDEFSTGCKGVERVFVFALQKVA